MPQILYLNGWPGGINTSLSAKDIADDELQDAINVELNQRRALRRRHGVSFVREATPGNGPFGSKVTSIYHFKLSDGTETVIYTDKNNAWRRAPSAPDTTTAFTAIDGSLPGSTGLATTDTFRWATMDDVAIGVNGGTDGATYDNPVVLTSATGNLTDVGTGDSWTGTYPTAPTDIAVWNRRVWLVEGNQLYGSALGDRTDWASTGGAGRFQETIGEDEGDTIIGIVPFLDRLIIFKEHRIYQLVAGSPNVDANQYEIRLLTDRVGCVRKETVQRVVNDLVFLSHFGVMSLQSTSQFGDLIQSQLSRKIPELAEMNKDGTFPTSVIHPEKNQYWLSVPTAATADAVNGVVYVLDFRDLQAGELPWMKFDGGVVGSAYGNVSYNGKPYVYIGGYNDAYVYDSTRWDDDVDASEATTSPAKYVTKAYDANEPLRRKEWYKVGVQVKALTDPLEFELQWKLDTDPNRIKAVAGSFSNVAAGSVLGPPGEDNILWSDDLVTTGDFLFATDAPDDTDIVWSIRGNAGRRAQSIEFTFQNGQVDEAFEVRRMMLLYDVLTPTSYGVRDFSG
jgi:hypothetical protein